MSYIKKFNDFLFEKITIEDVDKIIKKYIKDYEYTLEKTVDGIVVDMKIENDHDYDFIPHDVIKDLLKNFDNDIMEIYSEWNSHFTIYTKENESLIIEKKKKGRPKNIEIGLPKPDGFKTKLKGVGLGKDKKGYFVYTHRARSKSYKTVEKIPQKDINFIESTG